MCFMSALQLKIDSNRVKGGPVGKHSLSVIQYWQGKRDSTVSPSKQSALQHVTTCETKRLISQVIHHCGNSFGKTLEVKNICKIKNVLSSRLKYTLHFYLLLPSDFFLMKYCYCFEHSNSMCVAFLDLRHLSLHNQILALLYIRFKISTILQYFLMFRPGIKR